MTYLYGGKDIEHIPLTVVIVKRNWVLFVEKTGKIFMFPVLDDFRYHIVTSFDSIIEYKFSKL